MRFYHKRGRTKPKTLILHHPLCLYSIAFTPSLPLVYFIPVFAIMARCTRRSQLRPSNEDQNVLQGPGSNDIDHSIERIKDTTKGAFPDTMLGKSNHQKQARNVPPP